MILLLQWMQQGKIDLVTIPVFSLVGIPLGYWMNKDKPVDNRAKPKPYFCP